MERGLITMNEQFRGYTTSCGAKRNYESEKIAFSSLFSSLLQKN